MARPATERISTLPGYCREQVIVRWVDGRPVYSPEAALAVFERGTLSNADGDPSDRGPAALAETGRERPGACQCRARPPPRRSPPQWSMQAGACTSRCRAGRPVGALREVLAGRRLHATRTGRCASGRRRAQVIRPLPTLPLLRSAPRGDAGRTALDDQGARVTRNRQRPMFAHTPPYFHAAFRITAEPRFPGFPTPGAPRASASAEAAPTMSSRPTRLAGRSPPRPRNRERKRR